MLSVDKDTDPLPKIIIENGKDEAQFDRIHESAANMAVLLVRCNTTDAELHKRKFGSESRGRCIKAGQNWYTPIEFKALCGRVSAKDLTKSIQFGGRNLERLIDEEILKPHAISSFCAICCDDGSATSPVRLNTSRRRRRREDFDGEASSYMHQRDSSRGYKQQR